MSETAREKRYVRVLTIAGSDSGGGAGIQADLKTISAHGCYAMSVVTALTAQNTLGVAAIHPVPVAFVREQLQAVLEDIGCDAVKIGMLFSAELIEAVAGKLVEFGVRNVVLDPVMVAQSGDKLLEADAVDALRSRLLPLARVATPNLPEASVLLNRPVHHLDEFARAARDIAALGSANVLVKGGHLEAGDSDDLLYLGQEGRTVRLPQRRIATGNNHGTGCTLSSAIASGLAHGQGVEEAVRRAKGYTSAAIAAGAAYRIGGGHGPVHHFHGCSTWK